MSGDPTSLWRMAQRHVERGEWPQAEAVLATLLRTHPGLAPARLLLARVHQGQGRVRAACEQLKYAAYSLPPEPESLWRLAHALRRVGETVAARDLLRHPAVARVTEPSLLIGFSHLYQALGLHDEAMALLDKAGGLGLASPDFHYYRAVQLQFNGRLDEAADAVEACLRPGPTYGRASLMLARLRKATPAHHRLHDIDQRLRAVEPGSEDEASLEFARYKEHEDLGQFDQAWSALVRGNALMRARVRHDAAAESRLFDALITHCDEAFAQAPAVATTTGPQPIFILGLPRSGTTLLERLLSAHPQVASAGELLDFPRQLRWAADCAGDTLLDEALLAKAGAIDFAALGQRYLEQTQWRAGDRAFFVDKLPANFQLVGFIRRALPGARIVHMRRDAMDVCFSNYRALFGDAYGYSYDLTSLASHFHQYDRLMAHWRRRFPGALIEVSYSQLVQDTETAARALLDACGLPFDPALLTSGASAVPMATLSAAQVREPIHARSLGEWQRYREGLAPLLLALGQH